MADVVNEQILPTSGIEMKGELYTDRRSCLVRRELLRKGSVPVDRMIVKTANPAKRSEVVVKRPVLLHQEDDVLNRPEI